MLFPDIRQAGGSGALAYTTGLFIGNDDFHLLVQSRELLSQDLLADRYYLSLGNKEVKSKNERLSSVGSYTEATLQVILDKNKEVTFVTDDGNHFDLFRERLEKAIETCANPTQCQL